MLPLLSLLAGALVVVPTEGCEAVGARVGLDHVVVAVSDLGHASGRFRELGFTLKEGRLHPNGLRNRHVKLRDGTALELMTVEGHPGDAMARDYATFTQEGDGGAFLALRAESAHVLAAGRRLGLDTEPLHAGGFSYVTFGSGDLADVFFIDAYPSPADNDAWLAHDNGAVGLAAVWLEAPEVLGALLEALGGVACGVTVLPDGSQGRNYAVAGGSVVIVPARGSPRVRGVSVRVERGHAAGPPVRAHGVWIGMAPASGGDRRD